MRSLGPAQRVGPAVSQQGRRNLREEVSKKAGVDDPRHYYGLGATWGDYDNGGWPDLYVANDAGPSGVILLRLWKPKL